MNVRTVLMCAALMPLVLPAADYTLKSAPQSLADWRSGSFYEGEEAPPEDYSATIIIPEGLECLVNDDAMAFANGIRWFRTIGATSTVTFDVSTNSVLLASVAAGGLSWSNAGVLRKQGAGQLALTSAGRDATYGDYWVDMEVRAGSLRLDEGVYYGGWDVTEDAEIVLVGGTSTTRTFYIYSPKGLTGKGIVTNCTDVAGKCVLNFNSAPDVAPVFAGRILGKVTLWSIGNQDLVGTGSTIESVITRDGGMLGLSVIGRKGDPDSTIGTVETLLCRIQAPGSYRYVGQGETTDKTIQFGGYDNKGRAGFDAGAYGGVTFEGSFLMGYGGAADRFWLDGSNTVPCVVAGGWYDYSTHSSKTYLTKKGTGTWRFADYSGNDRTGLGAGFWIQNGTLGFETFNETNTVGALGNPCSFFIGDAFSESVAAVPKLPYCFRLGDTNDLAATGLLEYYGTKRTISRTRPVVVDGVGGFLSSPNADTRGASGVNAYLAEESGISALTDKAVLVLDGEKDGQDLVKDLTDGNGKLSVEKRGSGTWTIAGTNNTFTGDIAVKGGTLVLRGVSGKFTWFRFTAPIPTSYYFDLVQFGLFGADGTHLNPNLKLVPDAASDGTKSTINPSLYGKIGPGECCLGAEFNNGQSFVTASNSHLEHLFDCNGDTRCYCMNYDPGGDYSMVFRLPRSTDMASTWDFATINYAIPPATPGQGIPDWLQMEGSVDGETWYVADRIAGADVGPAGGYRCWRFNGVLVKNSVGKTPQVKITSGRPLVGYTNETVVVYSNPVSVANGATIEAEGLVKLTSFKVDGSAVAGTVKGFELADDLTIDVCNMPRDRRIELPIDFEDVSGLSDPENWTIKENGKETTKFSASVKDGKIVFERAGMTVIIK